MDPVVHHRPAERCACRYKHGVCIVLIPSVSDNERRHVANEINNASLPSVVSLALCSELLDLAINWSSLEGGVYRYEHAVHDVLISYITDNESRPVATEMDAAFVLRAVSQMHVSKTSVFTNGKAPSE